jgi:hypothetical protein
MNTSKTTSKTTSKNIVIPGKEMILEDPDILRKLLDDVNYQTHISDMLNLISPIHSPVDLDFIISIWANIRDPFQLQRINYYKRNNEIINKRYSDALQNLLKQLIEKENPTLSHINKMIDNNIPYRMIKVVLKKIKLSNEEILDIITRMTQRIEVNEGDVEIVINYKKLLCSHPLHRDQLMVWLLKHHNQHKMITSAKILYDMSEPQDRYKYFKMCCKIPSFSNVNTPLLEHMLIRSTPEELPGAKDIVLESFQGRKENVYRYLLLNYTKSI